VEEKVKKQHREYMLREQMKTVRKELGIEKDDAEGFEEKMKKRTKVCTLF
jgi:ATP-dependent Lon protease